jgi:hypothetical protein
MAIEGKAEQPRNQGLLRYFVHCDTAKNIPWRMEE